MQSGNDLVNNPMDLFVNDAGFPQQGLAARLGGAHHEQRAQHLAVVLRGGGPGSGDKAVAIGMGHFF
ncbi:MAG TPA: hypothetical protein VNU71_15125 [Burkholderiaceae bacterium]|nr:hypothetical protein [Burkholderiaceae bacterium]